ncbi:YkyA family protein [Heyndrickxia coagulans]|uniref:YkyA family protein n=1 Tax=Heyndrickxia coagulans TaxID=1398 RepID=UPI003D1EC582
MRVNRFIVFGMMLPGLLLLLAGCHSDKKQADSIYEELKKSASYEKDFVANQEKLDQYKEKVASIYADLNQLELNDENRPEVKRKLKTADSYTEKQWKELRKSKKNFQKAYEQSTSIKENVEKIKDGGQRKQAQKLLTIMDERKKYMNTFFGDYKKQLALQGKFYKNLEKFSPDELDNQIKKINEYNGEMEQTIRQFNQDTKRYNREKDKYFKKAGLY